MDGWVTIGTELSTSKFDRQIADLEKKMQKEEDKKIQIEAKIDTQTTEFEDAIAETDKYADALERVQKLKEMIAGQNATPQQFTELQDLTRQFGTEEQITTNFDKALAKQIKIEEQLQKTKKDYDDINIKVSEYANKIEQVNMQKNLAEIEETKKSFEGVGKSIQKSIKSIARFALSIIGIRSIYLGIRQMASTLSQYNEDLANKIEAIKLSLASALAPIVEFIVNLLTKAVALLGFVLKQLFGVDIFARASAMSLKKATGSAKELRKQLAGFDEMNVLNADGTTNLGGIGGLSQTIQDMNALGEGVFEKVKKWFSIKGAKEAFGKFVQDLKTTFKPVANWIYNNVWIPMRDNFGVVIKTFEPLLQPLKEAWNKMINEYLKPLWDGFVSYMKPNVIDPIVNYFKPIGRDIYNFIVPYANKIIDIINQIFGIFGIHLDHWEYKTEEKSEEVKEDITNAMTDASTATATFKDTANANLSQVGNNADAQGDKISSELGGALVYAGQKAMELSNKRIDIKTDMTGINNVEWGLDNILSDLWELVKKPWNIVTKIVTQGSNSFNNFLQPFRDALSFIGFHLPKLATGGIVNMPNKGTYIGGAIAGEAGREGVIPLTDQQAMAELGREIGKNVLVNLTNITEMNGRVISRELKQVQNNQDFAYNT